MRCLFSSSIFGLLLFGIFVVLFHCFGGGDVLVNQNNIYFGIIDKVPSIIKRNGMYICQSNA